MSEMTSRNKLLMRRMYEEMWNRRNPALAVELFTRPEGVERFVSGFLSSFPDLQHTVEGMLTEGDGVAVRFSAKGTHTGQWMHFKPSNRPIHYKGVTWARIEGGRIVEHSTLWDKAGLIEQIQGRIVAGTLKPLVNSTIIILDDRRIPSSRRGTDWEGIPWKTGLQFKERQTG